jgi:hypothetical protein
MNRERLVSVDAFRGATVAAMILVNNPGDWGNIYDPLEHAAVALIRRPMHDGQNARPLQPKATSRASLHPRHFSRAKARHRSPQSRYARSYFRAWRGMRTASAPSSMAPNKVPRLSRTTS